MINEEMDLKNNNRLQRGNSVVEYIEKETSKFYQLNKIAYS